MNKATEFKFDNFSFLSEHYSLFVQLAERTFASDPNTTLIKLRQFGEALAQHLAALQVSNLTNKPASPSFYTA